MLRLPSCLSGLSGVSPSPSQLSSSLSVPITGVLDSPNRSLPFEAGRSLAQPPDCPASPNCDPAKVWPKGAMAAGDHF